MEFKAATVGAEMLRAITMSTDAGVESQDIPGMIHVTDQVAVQCIRVLNETNLCGRDQRLDSGPTLQQIVDLNISDLYMEGRREKAAREIAQRAKKDQSAFSNTVLYTHPYGEFQFVQMGRGVEVTFSDERYNFYVADMWVK